jgi:hypothetical protein
MAGSGACCLVIGLLFGKAPLALLAVATFWGATVVADSAQFSACVTEFADPRYLGTALTLQTCIGFLITTLSDPHDAAARGAGRVGVGVRVPRAGTVARDPGDACDCELFLWHDRR